MDLSNKITRLNYLMQGMEKEKYLKPHLSKNLKPLIDYLFHNSEFYNIPTAIKEGREGIFRFSDEPIKSSIAPASSISRGGMRGLNYDAQNETNEKIRKALASAKKSKSKPNESLDYYDQKNQPHRNVSIENKVSNDSRKLSNGPNDQYELVYSSVFDPNLISLNNSSALDGNQNRKSQVRNSKEGPLAPTTRYYPLLLI
jgi:hypothetical protein